MIRALTARKRLTALYLTLFALAGGVVLYVSHRLLASHLGAIEHGTIEVPETATAANALDVYRVRALDELLVILTLMIAAVAAIAGWVVWLVAGRLLRPLAPMTQAVNRISERNLAERLTVVGPCDELRALAETFNAMMDRIEVAFASERRMIANASHELGTPIANQTALLDVALADPNPTVDHLRAACQAAHEEAVRAARLLRGMLTMAQAEQGELRTTSTRVKPVVLEAASALRSSDPSMSIELDDVVVAADEFLLGRLVTNLLTNAVVHNVPDGWIRVSLERSGSWAALRVCNSSLPLDPTLIENLAKPFERGTVSRTQSHRGSGLGLSIAKAVATAHGWNLTIRPQARTFEVEVVLPLDGPVRTSTSTPNVD